MTQTYEGPLPPQWLPIGLVHLNAISQQRVRDYAEEYARQAVAQALAEQGEPMARLLVRIDPNSHDRGRVCARTYDELPENTYPDTWQESTKLYARKEPK